MTIHAQHSPTSAFVARYTHVLWALGAVFSLPLMSFLISPGAGSAERPAWILGLTGGAALGCLAVAWARTRCWSSAAWLTRAVSCAMLFFVPVGTAAWGYWFFAVRSREAEGRGDPVSVARNASSGFNPGYTAILSALGGLGLGLPVVNYFYPISTFDGSLLMPTIASKALIFAVGGFIAFSADLRSRNHPLARRLTVVATIVGAVILAPMGTLALLYWFGWVRSRENTPVPQN